MGFQINHLILIILFLNRIDCCNIDNDCDFYQICSTENICIHKNVFPIIFSELVAYFFVILATVVTTIGGIGGGIFYLPIFMLLLNFKISEAIPLSIANVLGVLLFRFIIPFLFKIVYVKDIFLQFPNGIQEEINH